MNEPSLVSPTAGTNVYRFTLLPTWGHPIAVRLTVSKTTSTIEAKRLDGQGGYDPGKLVETSSVTITAAQVREFREIFGQLAFATMSPHDSDRGDDGSEWILEAVEDGKYHVTVRWTPTAYDTSKRGLTAFVNVCDWLYRASGLKGDVTNKSDIEISKIPKSK